MRITYLSFIVLLFIANISIAQSFKGQIKLFTSNEPISGINILVGDSILTSTDGKGFFSFNYPENRIAIKIQSTHYKFIETEIYSNKDNLILLEPAVGNLENVSVMAYRLRRGNNSFSYTVKDVKGLSTIIGETDVMRYISILPGTSVGIEGGLSNFVRGGGNGNNRVELDQVPVYGPTHLFGLFSVFHPAIVKDVNFQMGGITAASGNLLSSLLQINTVTPDLEKTNYDFSISPFMADASVNGYLNKGKSGYQVAARASLLPAEYALVKALTNSKDKVNPRVNDIYGSLFFKLRKTDNLKASLYLSDDYFHFKSDPDDYSNIINEFGISWSNKLGKIEWNKSINSSWNAQLLGYFNSFNSTQQQQEFDDDKLTSGLLMNNRITEYALKGVTKYIRKNNNIFLGINYSGFNFQPGTQKVATNENSTQSFSHTYHPAIMSLFGEWLYASSKFKAKLDLRGNYYSNQDYNTISPDIRFLTSLFITKNFGVEASYDENNQFFHALEGLPIGWSLDLTVPAAEKFKPETSEQFYLGIFGGNSWYYATIGAYYKLMDNLTYYKTTNNLFGIRNGSWEDEIVTGKGNSKGVEAWIEKRAGLWTWSLSYTLSKTDRRFSEVNDGNTFPFKFDRRHNLNYQTKYVLKKTEKKENALNLSFFFSAGNRVTIPVGKYQGITPPFWNQMIPTSSVTDEEDDNANSRQEMSSFNGYQMPNYIRADLAYSLLKKKKKYTREFIFSIYNVLNRQNPYLIFHEDNKWKQLSILPIIPSITWRVFF